MNGISASCKKFWCNSFLNIVVDVSLYQYFHFPGIMIQFVAKIPICKHKVCLFFTHDFSTKGLHHAPAINESAFWYFAAFYCLCLTLTYYQEEHSENDYCVSITKHPVCKKRTEREKKSEKGGWSVDSPKAISKLVLF